MFGSGEGRTPADQEADRRRFYSTLDDALYISGRLEDLHADEQAQTKVQQLELLLAKFRGPAT